MLLAADALIWVKASSWTNWRGDLAPARRSSSRTERGGHRGRDPLQKPGRGLITFLEDEKMLLVLENCEHVVRSANWSSFLRLSASSVHAPLASPYYRR